MNNIGQFFTEENWKFMNPELSPTELTELYEYYTGEILNTFCPEKKVFGKPDEPPWITENLKQLKRCIMREYEKNTKSIKYLELKSLFDKKMENEIQKYKNKIIEDVMNGNRSSTYSALRKLGVRPGEQNCDTFTLPEHTDNNLTAQQSAEIMADHFAAISQNYDPIMIDNFPPKIREELLQPDLSATPSLEEYEVYNKMCAEKKAQL